jgi:hypothetical protein
VIEDNMCTQRTSKSKKGRKASFISWSLHYEESIMSGRGGMEGTESCAMCTGKGMGIQQLRLLHPDRVPFGGLGHKDWK